MERRKEAMVKKAKEYQKALETLMVSERTKVIRSLIKLDRGTPRCPSNYHAVSSSEGKQPGKTARAQGETSEAQNISRFASCMLAFLAKIH